jgi:Tfp pilus assembly protein PilZ
LQTQLPAPAVPGFGPGHASSVAGSDRRPVRPIPRGTGRSKGGRSLLDECYTQFHQFLYPDRKRAAEGTDLRELRRSLLTNLSRGGVFITTDRPAEIGTRLELRLQIEDTGEEIDVPAEVVSRNLGPACESGQSGMRLRFLEMKPEEAQKVAALYERKLKAAAGRQS